jgi:hypothetical protein
MSGRHRAARGGVKTGETGAMDASESMGIGPTQMRELAASLPAEPEVRAATDLEPVGDFYELMAQQATNLAYNTPRPALGVQDLISNLQAQSRDTRNTLLSTVGVDNPAYIDENRMRDRVSNVVSALAGYLAPSARPEGFLPTYALRTSDATSSEAMVLSQELDGIVGARPLAEGGHTQRKFADGTGSEDIYTMSTELDQVLMRTTRTHLNGPQGVQENISIQFLRTDKLAEGQAPSSKHYADLPDEYTEEARAKRRNEAVVVPLDTAEMQKYAAHEAAAEQNIVPTGEFYEQVARQTENWAVAWPEGANRLVATQLADNIRAKAQVPSELTMIRGGGHVNRADEMDSRTRFADAMRIAANQLAAPGEDADPGPVLLYGTDRPESDGALSVTDAIKDVFGAQPIPQAEFAARRNTAGVPEDAIVMATQWPNVYLYDVRQRSGEGSLTSGQQKLALWRLTPVMGESMIGNEFIRPKYRGWRRGGSQIIKDGFRRLRGPR